MVDGRTTTLSTVFYWCIAVPLAICFVHWRCKLTARFSFVVPLGSDGGDDDDDVQMTLLGYACFSVLRRFLTPAAAERHRTPRGRTTAPRPHTVFSAKERAPAPYSASAGRRKEHSRRRLARSPGKERIPGKRGEFPTFSEALPSPNFFFVPLFVIFPGMKQYHPPPAFSFVSQCILAQR